MAYRSSFGPPRSSPLAEQIERGSPGGARGGLVVVLDGPASATMLAAPLPPGSLVVTAGVEPVPDGAGFESRVVAGVPELRTLIHERHVDALLVSDPGLLTPAVVPTLRAGLEADSACATVSLDDRARPARSGLPPPGAVGTHRGVVLVRREHLMLALDEAGLGLESAVGGGPPAGDGFVAQVLAALSRPGFLHRVAPAEAEAPHPRSGTRVPAAGRFAADVVLDGRSLDRPLSGTQVHLLGLARGLARLGARVAVMRPRKLHPTVVPEADRLGRDVPFLERSRVEGPAIFHRPYQVSSLAELADCIALGERLVLTQQDMILDRTPAYARSSEEWRHFVRATDAALCSADQVGFFSQHAARDAASDGALEPDRATVVPLGVDHLSWWADDGRVADPLRGRPYLLVLGNTYWHKNRLFALRLFQWLLEREAWDGGLVLAGGDTGQGSSVGAEQAVLRASPVLRERVVDLGHVPEVERAALYRGAELVLFPSMYEGFGLVPFEAAACGTACVYTFRSSIPEFLPPAGALPSFELDQAGKFVSSLLRDGGARARLLEAINDASKPLTWERTAMGYLDVYARALAREPRRVSRLLVGVGPFERQPMDEQEALLLDLYRRRRGFRFAVDNGLRAARAIRDRVRVVHRRS